MQLLFASLQVSTACLALLLWILLGGVNFLKMPTVI